MSLFPVRTSVGEFLERYNQLGGDDDDAGIDLFGEQDDEEEEEGEDDQLELQGLIDTTEGLNGGDDTVHKGLDAARRKEEARQVEALARRFEERAHDYELDREDDRHASTELTAAALAAQKAARKREEAAARAKAQAEAEEEAEAARKAEAQKQALASLYDLYGGHENGQSEGDAGLVTANVEKRKEPEKDAPRGKAEGRYRIKKKAKLQ